MAAAGWQGGDPLDDIGSLVEQSLNILGASGGDYAALGGGPEEEKLQPRQAPELGSAQHSSKHPLEEPLNSDPVPKFESLDLDLLGAATSVTAASPDRPSKGAASLLHTGVDEDIPLGGGEVPIKRGPLETVEESANGMSSRSGLSGGEGHVMSEIVSGASSASPGPGPGPSPGSFAGRSGGSALAAPAQAVRVWIRDPERQEGINKLGIKTSHFTYLVRTESTLPGMRADGTEVRRRFSEFDALHKVLKGHYRGYIIPPLPEKSFIESKLGQEDFLRLRRADLQAFLRGIAAHPVLRESEALRLFLLQPGELQYNPAWTALVADAAQPHDVVAGGTSAHAPAPSGAAQATAKAAAGFTSLVTWVRQSVLSTGAMRRELDEDELQLRRAKELMRDLERLLQLSCESARQLCGHMEAMSADFYELGRNMGMLSKWEEALQAQSGAYTEAGHSAGKRAGDCRALSYSNAKQQALWKGAAVKTAASLVSLHDYYILIPEAVAALEERERCLDHIAVMEEELANTQAQLAKGAGAKGPVGGRDKRAYHLTHNAERLEEALKGARELYATIKERNQHELLRLHLAREQDFRAMMANFAAVQASLVQASADLWRAAANQFAVKPAEQPPVEDTSTAAAD